METVNAEEMSVWVFDSFALLAYFRNEDGADEVERYLNEAASGKCSIFITHINVGEVYYMSYRKDGSEKAEKVWKLVQQFPINIIETNLAFTYKAAGIKARHKISYADAFAAALTIEKKATLLTGDHEFDDLNALPGFQVKYL